MPCPPPPYCSGTARPSQPPAARSSYASCGNLCSSSHRDQYAWSYFAATARTPSRTAMADSGSSKSMSCVLDPSTSSDEAHSQSAAHAHVEQQQVKREGAHETGRETVEAPAPQHQSIELRLVSIAPRQLHCLAERRGQESGRHEDVESRAP